MKSQTRVPQAFSYHVLSRSADEAFSLSVDLSEIMAVIEQSVGKGVVDVQVEFRAAANLSLRLANTSILTHSPARLPNHQPPVHPFSLASVPVGDVLSLKTMNTSAPLGEVQVLASPARVELWVSSSESAGVFRAQVI